MTRTLRRLAGTAPATTTLYAVILVTSLVQWRIGAEAAHRITQQVSSNLSNLLTFRLPVLVASALWLEGDWLVPQLGVWLLLFVVVLAPAERWLGTRRWLLAFTTAHIGATVVTAFRLWIAVRVGHQPPEVRDAVDVGVSYGFLGVTALSVYRLPGRWGWVIGAALLAPLLVVLRVDRQFTDAGHVTAVVIGFALYPLAHSANTSIHTRPLASDDT